MIIDLNTSMNREIDLVPSSEKSNSIYVQMFNSRIQKYVKICILPFNHLALNDINRFQFKTIILLWILGMRKFSTRMPRFISYFLFIFLTEIPVRELRELCSNAGNIKRCVLTHIRSLTPLESKSKNITNVVFILAFYLSKLWSKTSTDVNCFF